MSFRILVLSVVFLMTLPSCEDPEVTPVTCGEGTELSAAGDVCIISQAALTQSFDEGVASVDITTDNQASYDEGFAAGADSVDITMDNQGVAEQAFSEGVASVDITTDNQAFYDEGFSAGVASVDITTDNQVSYDEGFVAGVASVDITTDNQTSYDQGFVAGVASVDITTDNQASYDSGFTAGAASVDITSDNDTIYSLGFEAGAASVDVTSDNDEVYNLGFSEGVASVDITSDNATIFDDGFTEGAASVVCDPVNLQWFFETTGIMASEHIDETFLLQMDSPEVGLGTVLVTATLPEPLTGYSSVGFLDFSLNGTPINMNEASITHTNVDWGLEYTVHPNGNATISYDAAFLDATAGPATVEVAVPVLLTAGLNELRGEVYGFVENSGTEDKELKISFY